MQNMKFGVRMMIIIDGDERINVVKGQDIRRRNHLIVHNPFPYEGAGKIRDPLRMLKIGDNSLCHQFLPLLLLKAANEVDEVIKELKKNKGCQYCQEIEQKCKYYNRSTSLPVSRVSTFDKNSFFSKNRGIFKKHNNVDPPASSHTSTLCQLHPDCMPRSSLSMFTASATAARFKHDKLFRDYSPGVMGGVCRLNNLFTVSYY